MSPPDLLFAADPTAEEPAQAALLQTFLTSSVIECHGTSTVKGHPQTTRFQWVCNFSVTVTEVTTDKIVYFLLLIAHLLSQLMARGSLFRQAFPQGVGSAKNLGLLEARRNLRLTATACLVLIRGHIQIRFNTS